MRSRSRSKQVRQGSGSSGQSAAARPGGPGGPGAERPRLLALLAVVAPERPARTARRAQRRPMESACGRAQTAGPRGPPWWRPSGGPSLGRRRRGGSAVHGSWPPPRAATWWHRPGRYAGSPVVGPVCLRLYRRRWARSGPAADRRSEQGGRAHRDRAERQGDRGRAGRRRRPGHGHRRDREPRWARPRGCCGSPTAGAGAWRCRWPRSPTWRWGPQRGAPGRFRRPLRRRRIAVGPAPDRPPAAMHRRAAARWPGSSTGASSSSRARAAWARPRWPPPWPCSPPSTADAPWCARWTPKATWRPSSRRGPPASPRARCSRRCGPCRWTPRRRCASTSGSTCASPWWAASGRWPRPSTSWPPPPRASARSSPWGSSATRCASSTTTSWWWTRPATGHIVGQLAAPQAINELVKVGLIRSQTDWMLDILSDPRQHRPA